LRIRDVTKDTKASKKAKHTPLFYFPVHRPFPPIFRSSFAAFCAMSEAHGGELGVRVPISSSRESVLLFPDEIRGAGAQNQRPAFCLR
jgi:hypothetical protein